MLHGLEGMQENAPGPNLAERVLGGVEGLGEGKHGQRLSRVQIGSDWFRLVQIGGGQIGWMRED